MRKALFPPAAALAGGVIGFFLRRWELDSAFEAESGLPIPGAAAFWALVLWSVLIAGLLLLLLRGKHSPPAGYDQAFSAKGNTLYITTMVLAAFLLLGAGALGMIALPAEQAASVVDGMNRRLANPGLSALIAMLPKVLAAVLALGSGFALFAVGRNNYRGQGKGTRSLPLLLPGYLAFFWLITEFQSHSGDPVRQGYIYKLFAILAILLAQSLIAGYSFEKGKFTRTALFTLLGVYFSIVTLADQPTPAAMLLLGGFILYQLATATTLIHNDALRVLYPTYVGDEIKTEENTDEGQE